MIHKVLLLMFSISLAAYANDYDHEKDMLLINKIYSTENIEKNPEDRTNIEALVYSVESYVQEIGSGEDFIQWFNWSDKKSIEELLDNLKLLGDTTSLNICKKAIAITFPSGIPRDASSYDLWLYDIEFEKKNEVIVKELRNLALQQLKIANKLESLLAKKVREMQKLNR